MSDYIGMTQSEGDEFMREILGALKRCMPPGSEPTEHTLSDRIGALILCRIVAKHTTNVELLLWLTMFASVVGPTTGLREPEKSYVELLQQLN